LKLDHISCGYEGTDVIRKFNFEIARGDKIGIIGNNGRGKTTLIKAMAGLLPLTHGSVEKGHQVLLSYFPQVHEDVVDKHSSLNVFEWLKNLRSGLYDQDIRSALGKMLFSGDDAFKPVSKLSGGETARLILAGIILQDHNFLILDEPNNHLDLEAVSALAWGLNEYPGTVVVASHDRDLISSVATKLIAFEEDGTHFYDGTLDQYLEQKAAAQG
jgi:ATPase subunit of ABC transporter with duplicated ATPase domains